MIPCSGHFANFFTDKVPKVRADTAASFQPDIKNTVSDRLLSWTPITVMETEKMTAQAANKIYAG